MEALTRKQRNKQIGKVKLHWSKKKKLWVVKIGRKNMFETKDYKKAFFWRKYRKQITAGFLEDHILNV